MIQEPQDILTVSEDDLQTYKHFLHLFIQQQEMVAQMQQYLVYKYKLKDINQINIQSGQIV